MKHQFNPKDNDLHSAGLSQSPLSGDVIDDKVLEKTLVQNDYNYTKKRKLGKKVYEIINNHEVDEDSLRI